MKKAILKLGIISLFLSSCSVLTPAEPTATPAPTLAPTPTPDPCSKENILAEAEKIQMSVNEFREVADLANSTDVNFVFIPVLRLQEIRYEAINTKVPACLDSFKASAINYTASVISYLMVFMNNQDPESEDLKNAIQNSQTQWQILLNEFNTVLTIAGLEAQMVPTPAVSSATATNAETESVNVFAKPDSSAEVVASIEQGAQADVIGRNEAGDWLQVKISDIIGWVITGMVNVSIPVDQLTVIEAIP